MLILRDLLWARMWRWCFWCNSCNVRWNWLSEITSLLINYVFYMYTNKKLSYLPNRLFRSLRLTPCLLEFNIASDNSNAFRAVNVPEKSLESHWCFQTLAMVRLRIPLNDSQWSPTILSFFYCWNYLLWSYKCFIEIEKDTCIFRWI